MTKTIKGFKFFRGATEPDHVPVKENAPVAPTVDRKYIKGTPEWKAHKEKSKPINGHPTNVKEESEQIDELSRDTLLSYANKVSLDSQKHSKDPTKRSGEKASRSVTGYAKAHNRLEKPVKEETEELEEKSQQARRNKTYKNLMAASKGAKVNKDLGMTPADTGHKNNQQMNKAIGRAVYRGEVHEGNANPVNVDDVNAAGQKPHEEKWEAEIGRAHV